MISAHSDALLDRSFIIACEHAMFARENGQTPSQVLAALDELIPVAPTWDLVIIRLAVRWRMLQPEAARAA